MGACKSAGHCKNAEAKGFVDERTEVDSVPFKRTILRKPWAQEKGGNLPDSVDRTAGPSTNAEAKAFVDELAEIDHEPFKRTILGEQWIQEKGVNLRDSVDRFFATEGKSLLGSEFSFTIADPLSDGCPLLGCSAGFTKLCGYELNDIVGQHCCFLADQVPASVMDQNSAIMANHVRLFCQNAKYAKYYQVPEHDREAWMPTQHLDEFWCCQKSARKDGSIFWNLFVLKIVRLGADLGQERPYIVGLQSELPEGKATLAQMAENIQAVNASMGMVLQKLAAHLFVETMWKLMPPSIEASLSVTM